MSPRLVSNQGDGLSTEESVSDHPEVESDGFAVISRMSCVSCHTQVPFEEVRRRWCCEKCVAEFRDRDEQAQTRYSGVESLRRMSTPERIALFRELGTRLREWCPEAADYLETYDESRENAEGVPGVSEPQPAEARRQRK